MRAVWWWAVLWMLPGCGLMHRQAKLFAPEHVVTAPPPDTPAVWLEIEGADGVARPVVHETMEDRTGRTLVRPAVLRSGDTLRIGPEHDRARIRLWLQGTGWLGRRNRVALRTVVGSLDLRFANEIAFLPVDTPLESPFDLEVRQLSSPFNPYSFYDGDLLIVESEDADGHAVREVFIRRDPGVAYGFFAGVLATIPVSDRFQMVAPILAIGPTFGWRTRKTAGLGRILDQVELVLSFGVGSTMITDLSEFDPDPIRFFNAGLAGTGIRIFGVFSVQGYVNTNAFFRERLEAPATLAIGFDATGTARFFEDAWTRVFRRHPVQKPRKSGGADE